MTERRIVLAVVLILGALGLFLAGGTVLLVRELVLQGKGTGTVDPTAAAAVGSIGTLAGTVIGALGAMLVSTRTAPGPAAPPTPVTVENALSDPVPTTDGDVAPEPERAEPPADELEPHPSRPAEPIYDDAGRRLRRTLGRRARRS